MVDAGFLCDKNYCDLITERGVKTVWWVNCNGRQKVQISVGQPLLYNICCSFSAVKYYMDMYLSTGSINVVQYIQRCVQTTSKLIQKTPMIVNL